MSKLYYYKAVCCFALIFLCQIASAQSESDSLVYENAVASLGNRFYQGVGEQSRLYNGLVYDSYDSSIKGSPYLDDIDTWRAGSVIYDGEDFSNVSMIYDLYTDQLVVMLFNHASPLALIAEKVTAFDLHDRHFVRIVNTNLKTGYYEQLYGGRSQVLKKIEKLLKSASGSTGRSRYFVLAHDVPDYFIKKGNTYYKVGTRNDVLDLLIDKKKELKQYIKDKHIQFDDFPEQSLALLTKYYDSLTN